MSIEVLTPGLSTTVQDQGRLGYYHLGLPQGGALDAFSAQAANSLVGNTASEALLECTYMGSNLRFESDAIVAITGAPIAATVDGTEVPTWTRLDVPAGSTLEFGILTEGARFYIAVRGGIDVPEVLGSRSTYMLGGFGGFHGRKLQAGDTLSVGQTIAKLPSRSSVAEELRPTFNKSVELRIVLGLYDHKLTDNGKYNLINEEWRLTPVADRAGMRFEGPGVEWRDEQQPFGAGSDPSNIVDAGYAVGSIQIPGGTQPIVLHRDAVSGGGYAMVGTVISADMDKVARLAPGAKTRFIEVDMDAALAARLEYNEALARLWN